jgi:site-specific DNA-methyltransferase (adenine-specific)
MVRKPTATSNFGVSKRESHDASDFYARFRAPEISKDAEVSPPWEVDSIFHGSATDMTKIAPKSVALVVTSPPYFAGKQYEEELGEGHVPATYIDYLTMLRDVFAECARKLEPGGRIAVNVANLGRKPFRSLAADVTTILQDDLGLLLRGEIVWQKARGAAGSCAWGSFMQPANPVLRDLTERVVVASKGRFDRAVKAVDRRALGLPHQASMSKDEFMEATTDVWEISPESARRVGHPAPFPVELPERLIHLYTYYDDVVLDPFMGSGTTAVAAVRTGRHFVGYDTDEQYIELARARVDKERARLRRDAAAPRAAVPSVAPAGEDEIGRAWREGRAAKERAQVLLDECGFTRVVANPKLPAGVDVSFRAVDPAGREWLFEVAGGITSSRPGLKRSDTLWKTIAKAAVVHAAAPECRFVVLTPALPARASAAANALAAVTGAARPIADVVDLGATADRERLRAAVADSGRVR